MMLLPLQCNDRTGRSQAYSLQAERHMLVDRGRRAPAGWRAEECCGWTGGGAAGGCRWRGGGRAAGSGGGAAGGWGRNQRAVCGDLGETSEGDESADGGGWMGEGEKQIGFGSWGCWREGPSLSSHERAFFFFFRARTTLYRPKVRPFYLSIPTDSSTIQPNIYTDR